VVKLVYPFNKEKNILSQKIKQYAKQCVLCKNEMVKINVVAFVFIKINSGEWYIGC
jgi:hypothetical protein